MNHRIQKRIRKRILPEVQRRDFYNCGTPPNTSSNIGLVDGSGEPIKGKFYEHEIQKINKTDVYEVERVLKSRKRDGKDKYYKWKGYPRKFNS